MAAAVCMGGAAAGFAGMGLFEADFVVMRLALFGFAALVGVAAVGLTRKSLMAQVLSRALAWVVLLPWGAGVVGSLVEGRWPGLGPVLMAAAPAAALLLARPALHTPEAKREFSPVAYRRLFLGGATASATAGIVAGLGATEALGWAAWRDGLGLAALATALLASAIGVVRMRAWGVLLGALTSTAMLGAAALAGEELGTIGFALAAVPGLLLLAPLVAARVRPPAIASGVRVAPSALEHEIEPLAPVRARIEDLSDAEQHDDSHEAPLLLAPK